LYEIRNVERKGRWRMYELAPTCDTDVACSRIFEVTAATLASAADARRIWDYTGTVRRVQTRVIQRYEQNEKNLVQVSGRSVLITSRSIIVALSQY
jgi:hypothetical protein